MRHEAAAIDPVVYRRRLRRELRMARNRAGRTQREVVVAMNWSPSKLMRIESGAFNISPNDLRALLELYGVAPDRVAALLELARAARGTPHWNLYRNVADVEYLDFLGLESGAAVIRNVEPSRVPGLLQTEEYAREVIRAMGHDDPEVVEALVDLRMERQARMFTRRPAPRLHFILDEAVIRRVVGGRGVAQLAQLTELAALPNVTVGVLPFNAGMYRRLGVPYVLLEIPQDGHILYLEGPTGELIVHESPPAGKGTHEPARYLAEFTALQRLAPPESLARCVEPALAALVRVPVRRRRRPGEAAS